MAHRDGLEPVDLLLAQSVVFHALDYADALGFRPHRDFDPSMLGARPSVLESTPLARPPRPFYVPGPDDDVARIDATLRAAVGEDGHDLPDDEAVMTAEPRADEASLSEAIRTWFGALQEDDRLDF